MYYPEKANFEAAILGMLKPLIDRGSISREEALDISDELFKAAKAVATTAVKRWLDVGGRDVLSAAIASAIEQHTGRAER
jgi:hypothetical protein